jgi:hypothetical protein
LYEHFPELTQPAWIAAIIFFAVPLPAFGWASSRLFDDSPEFTRAVLRSLTTLAAVAAWAVPAFFVHVFVFLA